MNELKLMRAEEKQQRALVKAMALAVVRRLREKLRVQKRLDREDRQLLATNQRLAKRAARALARLKPPKYTKRRTNFWGDLKSRRKDFLIKADEVLVSWVRVGVMGRGRVRVTHPLLFTDVLSRGLHTLYTGPSMQLRQERRLVRRFVYQQATVHRVRSRYLLHNLLRATVPKLRRTQDETPRPFKPKYAIANKHRARPCNI